jgi:hypothetical protein
MQMRMGRLVSVAFLAVALVACGGGGKKSTTVASVFSSTGSSVVAGSGAPVASASSSSDASSDGAAGDSPVVGADPSAGSDQAGTPVGGDAPVPPGLKPFPGHYTYQVTGQSAPAVVTVEDVNDTDQRTTTPGAGAMGEQVQVLRFLADRIDLLSLEMKGAFAKTFNGPVLFAPIPPTVGASWAWDLTSTDNLTHVHQSSRVDRTEAVIIGGQSVDTFVVETDITITGDVNATGHLTSFGSGVYKLPVRTHTTLNVTTPVNFSSDTTAELTNLRPS